MGFKKSVKRATAMALSAMLALGSFGTLVTVKADTTSAIIETASDRAYTWLKTMQDSTYQQKLVDSFEDYDSQGVAFPISYTYDQACASIAFLLKGDVERATKILDTLAELQVPQTDPEVKNRGAWCNSYYNNEAAYLAGQEVRLHVGVVMWVCMAVMEYEQVTGDTERYHEMAINAIDWALQFQQANGGVAGGRTTWDSGDGSWTDEVWSSTEHNEDIYGVLLYFAENTPEKATEYTTAANKVKNFLDNVVWDEANQRFYGGFKNNTGLIDPFVPMDVTPWGVLSLGTDGAHTYKNMLSYVENANGNPGTLNTPKYKQTLVYDGVNTLTAYDFDWQDDGAAASETSGGGTLGADVWFEGSAFMSAAYYLAGNTQKADEILVELAKKQSVGKDSFLGGIPYSLYGTNNNYWRMSAANCVSSTAWYIMAAERFNPFHAEYMDGSSQSGSAGSGDSGNGGSGTSGSTGNENTGSNTGSTSETRTGFGVSVSGTTATIWYAPETSCTWADVHYKVNGGAQQNFQMTYNSATNSWEKSFDAANGTTIEYFITYDANGLAYDTAWTTYVVGESSTSGGNTGNTNTGVNNTGYGVSVSGTTATIWYVPEASSQWVDVHCTINNGNQLNYRAAYNSTTGRWEQKVNLSKGDVLKYYFTYEKNLLAQDTEWYSYQY